MSEIAALDKRLQELHGQTAEAPLFNPVFQLSHELSRRMEKGDLSLDAVEALVAELECEGLSARARRLNRLVAPVAAEANLARVKAMAEGGDFASFAARWSRPVAHVVFTAHPTFLLPRAHLHLAIGSQSLGNVPANPEQLHCRAVLDHDRCRRLEPPLFPLRRSGHSVFHATGLVRFQRPRNRGKQAGTLVHRQIGRGDCEGTLRMTVGWTAKICKIAGPRHLMGTQVPRPDADLAHVEGGVKSF